MLCLLERVLSSMCRAVYSWSDILALRDMASVKQVSPLWKRQGNGFNTCSRAEGPAPAPVGTASPLQQSAVNGVHRSTGQQHKRVALDSLTTNGTTCQP